MDVANLWPIVNQPPSTAAEEIMSPLSSDNSPLYFLPSTPSIYH